MTSWIKRLLTTTLLLLASAICATAAMNCNTRSVPSPSGFEACVSPDYNPAFSLLDGAASTADAYSRFQWNMRQVLEGEQYTTLFSDAPRDVKVAVIDQYPGSQGHPDLVNRYETGINLVEGGTNTNPPSWDGTALGTSHGQCVASVIAAEHNSIGVAGVFARARIIPIRASVSTLPAAIDAAVAAGAEVIHIAGFATAFQYEDYFVYPNYDAWPPTYWPLRWMMKDVATAIIEKGHMVAIRDAIERAVWDHNVVISTVVGNWSGADATVLMPSIHETIAAGATNVLGEPSPFNTNNYYTTLLAPGGDRRVGGNGTPADGWPPDFWGPTYGTNVDDILCASGPTKYRWGSGGSFAGPHLAAAAAIIKSYIPNATAQDVRRLLVRSRQPIMLNLHMMQSTGGMLSLKRLKAAILAE